MLSTENTSVSYMSQFDSMCMSFPESPSSSASSYMAFWLLFPLSPKVTRGP